ncbi:MAG: hypothetical protein ACP5H2_01045 [Solirubrobacteraceae bacterium]
MTSDGSPSSELDLDMLAAALRADISDIGAFLEGLAVRLEAALPGTVVVKRARQGFRGPKLVTEIVLDTGDRRLVLTRDGEQLSAVSARISGGIVLKREVLDIDAWLDDLTAVVAALAERSDRARQALQKLLLDR